MERSRPVTCRGLLLLMTVLFLVPGPAAVAQNVKDDFRFGYTTADPEEGADSNAYQLGYSHYFEALRSETDLPFNYEFFFSHPSSIAFNLSRLDSLLDSPVSDLTYNNDHLIGEWFFKERLGLLFSLERIENSLACRHEAGSPLFCGFAGTPVLSRLTHQTILVPSVGMQHFYAANGAWSVQYFYTSVRGDHFIDFFGTPAIAFDQQDTFHGVRGEWTHIWAKRFRLSLSGFTNVASTPPSQGIFPSPTSQIPGTFFKNRGGKSEFELAFSRRQSAQLTYSRNDAKDTDDKRTAYGGSYIVYFNRRATLLLYYGRVEDDSDTGTVKTNEAQVSVRFAK